MVSHNKIRLVFDSVFYFSLGLGGKIAKRIWEIVLEHENIELCLSSAHFNEIKAKLYGEQMREILDAEYDESLMSSICVKIAASHIYFYPHISVDLCSDKDDNFLLELAKNCNANFIITNRPLA
jgi:putative PIN family toxin of toxin-antitoxin system